jgi:predicted 3-demethylubiquinone-9 3-methyltransferase (glyoxalase superfamily)
MKPITPCLWFDANAEEAARFYVSVFSPRGGARMGPISRYGDALAEAAGRPRHSVMTVSFQLDDQEYMALNGGPAFTFTEAVSLMVNCDTQQEVDRLWQGLLSGGGQAIQCGWLKDRFGLAWQVIPTPFWSMVQDPDQRRVDRMMMALTGMVKLDLAALRKAYEG